MYVHESAAERAATPPPSPPEPRASPPDLIAIEDYRQVYEAVALPVLIIDHASWLILAVNEAALNQYGYERDEFVGMPVLEVRPPEGQAEARKVLSEIPHGFWKATAVRHRRKDGSVFSADVWSRDTVVDGRPVRIATIHEVTERLQLQQELQQAQKMEVLGRLAGGVAHDLNNALTAVIAGSHFLLEQFGDNPDARPDLELILQAADRAALVTRHLLAFSRQQVMRDQISPLAEVVERSVGLLGRLLEERIELQIRIEPGSWPVRVDPAQFEQVVMSMAVNAQEAMPTGGTLVLATANLSVSPRDASKHSRVPPGDYAVLSLRDTGIGMDELTRARIFEPFFTTKPPPTKSGLGLSMVHGIVSQSGGFITVESEPGAGTTFRIFLPRADPAPGRVAAIHEPEVPGGRTVLVVEGDDAMRHSTGRVLEGLGYRLVATASAEEALRRLDGLGQRPELLVTALGLPGMGGEQLADRLQASLPGLGVLFLSGYAPGADDSHRDVANGRRLLQKPFSVEALIEAVRQVVAAAA